MALRETGAQNQCNCHGVCLASSLGLLPLSRTAQPREGSDLIAPQQEARTQRCTPCLRTQHWAAEVGQCPAWPGQREVPGCGATWRSHPCAGPSLDCLPGSGPSWHLVHLTQLPQQPLLLALATAKRPWLSTLWPPRAGTRVVAGGEGSGCGRQGSQPWTLGEHMGCEGMSSSPHISPPSKTTPR